MSFLLAVDQSTSGTKALLIDKQGKIAARKSMPHHQYYPAPGWAEQDAEEIWRNVLLLIRKLPETKGASFSDIQAISICNQRETTVAWDRKTGKPLAPAVVWQCQRGAGICENLSAHSDAVRQKTGLSLSAYYPAAKAAWLVQNIQGLREKVISGEACIGTIDSYLIFRLTGGAVFATDYSNASRTQLFNIQSLSWDEELSNLFEIPICALPQVLPSDSIFGNTVEGLLPANIPISGIMGDSHAALFGQGCILPNMAKATYGTGSSVMINVGKIIKLPPPGIAASLAWGWQGEVNYVLEGNVTSSGDTLKWLVDELGLTKTVHEIDELSEKVDSTDGVYFVPAFSGLGAPYFDSEARAAIVGMSRASNCKHIARAALESIAFQNHSIIEAMGVKLNELRVDGGPTRSNVLMQFQSDLLNCPVCCSIVEEISALGTAYMGGLAIGFFKNTNQFEAWHHHGARYNPNPCREKIQQLISGWNQAVNRVRTT